MSIELTPEQVEAAQDAASNNSGPPKFVAKRLAEELAAETPIACGGEQLYTYRRGAYRPDGGADLRRRIAERLNDGWTRRKADEVLGYLRAVSPQLWPRPPIDLLNVRNGILDLDAGKLGPHDPAFLSPVQIAADHNPGATCPAVEQFLESTLGAELVPVVIELTGYLLTPDNNLQIAAMLLGEGENGKSTLLRLLTSILGAQNVSAVALHRLDEDRFAAAELYGKLANVFADLDARALRSSSMFKSITGGDAITAERKFRDAFTFTPYARLLYSANEVPPTPDSSDAFFRRWLILPFERSFRENPDRHIDAKLSTSSELSGLLNLALAALPDLRARGRFATTETTERAGARFRVDSDSVAGFLDEHTTYPAPEAHVAKSALFSRYRGWCEENGRMALSAVRFNRRVQAIARPEESRSDGVRQWVGIELLGSLR